MNNSYHSRQRDEGEATPPQISGRHNYYSNQSSAATHKAVNMSFGLGSLQNSAAARKKEAAAQKSTINMNYCSTLSKTQVMNPKSQSTEKKQLNKGL